MWWGEQEAGDVSFNPNVTLTHRLTPGKSLYFRSLSAFLSVIGLGQIY